MPGIDAGRGAWLQSSFRFLGNVLGPVTGGMVAASFGISYVFIGSGVLLLLTAVALKLVLNAGRESRQEENSA